MDVASGNVANAGVAGYTRRNVVGQTVGAPAVPALWSRWDGAGAGVQAAGVERMVDPLLDARSRLEHGSQSFLDTRAASLARVESTLGEPGDTGISAALAAFKQGWQDVANNPDDGAARSQLLARANTLVSAIHSQADSVSSEWSDQRTRLDALTTEVNDIATDLASLNESIQVAYNTGNDAGVLLDQRDQMTMRLAELTGASTDLQTDGTATVTVQGVDLVNGSTASTFAVAGATDMAAQATSPVTFSIGGSPGSSALPSGEVGASLDLLNQTLPDYLGKLDGWVATMSTAVNDQHVQGMDANGVDGGAFFTGSTATDLQVAFEDPDLIAAADQGAGALDGSNADALGNLPLGSEDYRRLITDFGSEVASANRVATNQSILTDQVDASRESLSGINIDEEMVNLLAAQRAYEGAARVMTVMDSVLDTLINRTGLVR
jgi:flagellar hook-associated protein 1 FlgK